MCRRPMDTLLSGLLYLCFGISLYLIYDWTLTERQIQCADSPQNYGLYTFENFTGVLLKDMEDANKPADTQEIDEFKSRLARVDWNQVDTQLKRFETVIGRLLEQLESASGRFIGPIRLRDSLIKEIEDYNLCRSKIKGDNRDLSHRYETLKSQQKENQEKLKDIEQRKLEMSKRQYEFNERKSMKRIELADKENELKRVEEDLDNFQEGGKEKIDKLYEEMQERAKLELEEAKLQLEEAEKNIIRVRSRRELLIEDSVRLNGKIEMLVASRDQTVKRLDKLELRIDYDIGLQKLLPQNETIVKTRQLEKTLTERFNLYNNMLVSARGLPNEPEIRKKATEMRDHVRKAKKILAGCSETKFKYNAGFERDIKKAKDELNTIDAELNDVIRARDQAKQKIAELSRELDEKQVIRDAVSAKLNVKERFQVPKDVEAERQYEDRKAYLTKMVSTLKQEIESLELTLSNMEHDLSIPTLDGGDMVRDFSAQSIQVNKKIKETQSQLNKFKRIMYGKLSECNNKKKFIESIQRQGAQQLEDAVRYYNDIRATKQQTKSVLDRLYIQ